MGKKNIQSGTEEFELFRDYWNLYKNNALVENNAEYFEKSSAGHGEILSEIQDTICKRTWSSIRE